LQLPYVLGAIKTYSLTRLLWDGAIFSAFVILLRLVWTFPSAYLAKFIRGHLLHQREWSPPVRGVLIVGWTGMRGVIALAAAIALPQMLENGQPFVQRDLIIFLAFSVIFVTLVLQGLTLPPLVRALGITAPTGANLEEASARREMLHAALTFLQTSRETDDTTFESVYEDIAAHYRQDLLALTTDEPDDNTLSQQHQRHTRLLRDLLRVERQTAVRLRNQGQINDETLRQLERELDLREANQEPGH
jgi:CPA1 family monovalent cation:H+ antiporter